MRYGTSVGLLYCLYLFRKIPNLFLQLHIFHPEVIALFNKIGRYLIVIGFLMLLSTLYVPEGYTFKTGTETGFSITKSFNYSFNFLNFEWLMVIGFGLFSQVLGEILIKARSLKQENDLTI